MRPYQLGREGGERSNPAFCTESAIEEERRAPPAGGSLFEYISSRKRGVDGRL